MKLNLYIIFLCGIMVGTIVANFFVNKNLACAHIFGPEIVSNYINVTIDKGEMFKYVLAIRLKEIFVLIAITFLQNAKKIYRGLVGVFGALFAYLESVIVMQYLSFGIVLFVASIFPQYLIYGFVFYILMKSLDFKKRKKVFLVCITLYVVGAFLESTINYEIVKKVLKIH